ncbi:hypothetical protein PGQ11_007381 [Apiospora arundinis]|uniref:Secreted protein n=1 Tax=Apiospora arundinis TaxID=335852 RepID=A0ABR2IVU0_9PEZI
MICAIVLTSFTVVGTTNSGASAMIRVPRAIFRSATAPYPAPGTGFTTHISPPMWLAEMLGSPFSGPAPAAAAAEPSRGFPEIFRASTPLTTSSWLGAMFEIDRTIWRSVSPYILSYLLMAFRGLRNPACILCAHHREVAETRRIYDHVRACASRDPSLNCQSRCCQPISSQVTWYRARLAPEPSARQTIG